MPFLLRSDADLERGIGLERYLRLMRPPAQVPDYQRLGFIQPAWNTVYRADRIFPLCASRSS
jgi:hypothetical protein